MKINGPQVKFISQLLCSFMCMYVSEEFEDYKDNSFLLKTTINTARNQT